MAFTAIVRLVVRGSGGLLATRYLLKRVVNVCSQRLVSSVYLSRYTSYTALSTGAAEELPRGRGHKCVLVALAVVALVQCDSRRAGNRLSEDETKLLKAVKDGDIRTLQRLINDLSVEVNIRHALGWTPLHVAVINGDIRAIKELVKAGADINIKDEFSSSRRVAARKRVHFTEVENLRDREFCSWINHSVSYSGFTPLHYAVIKNDVKIIQYLLENGADPSIENNNGYTPSNYCTDEKVKHLLKEQEIKINEHRLQEALEERRKFPLEERLRKHIVGQEGPIATVAGAIRRKEMGWGDSEHPLVLLFLGSSGIGKTELAKRVAHYIHKDNPKGFIRIDMSEFQQKHEVAKLIGAPPGYIGYDQGGQLTSRLRECPNAVVLFDEVDKAHPDVLTVLLQLFDEGRLTDGQGKTIECKDAIFVMTSNLASDEIASHALKLRRETRQALKEYRKTDMPNHDNIEISRTFKETVVEPILKYHFQRDEFLGRINEMVYFLPFSRTELNQLVEQELTSWKLKAEERHKITLTWDKEVLDVVADGYNVKYGARSIHHEVERRVINILAIAYERGNIKKGSTVHLVVDKNQQGTPLITIKNLSPVKYTEKRSTNKLTSLFQ